MGHPAADDEGDRMTDTVGTAAMDAVGDWYHAFFTGSVLTVVSRRGPHDAAGLVFRIFRHQQQERFLPGLEKLGLRDLPPAVAAARYHYLSNAIGGVGVEYHEESDRKAWIRYPPPRWVWQGTAICGIPGVVNAAMLRGWHAHNGVALGCPRLGFVCTGQTVDGQPGLEGYYLEHDRDLEPEERLRFSRGETMPPHDPARAPVLPAAGWPPERLAKAKRGYAMEYVRTALQEAVALFGPVEGGHLLGLAARLVAMQHYAATAAALGLPRRGGIQDFAAFMVALAAAQGDGAEIIAAPNGDGLMVRQEGLTLVRGIPHAHPAMLDAWNELLVGALAAHDRFARLHFVPGPGHKLSWHLRAKS
jgi:hypothetical protein